MSAAPIIIVITRPRKQAAKSAEKLGDTTEIQVLAPEGASDAEILQLGLNQLANLADEG